MEKGFRPDKSLYIVLAGLLIGALVGGIFTLLEDTGARILASLVGGGNTSAPRIGFTAPDFELLDLNGKPVRLSGLKGLPVMINFWATWCNPCRVEMPLIQSMVEQYPDLVVLAVNADEPVRIVQPFVEKMGLTFPILLDPNSKVEIMYQVQGLPTSFFVDAKGIIRAVQVGVLSEEKLSEHLNIIGVMK